MNKLNTLAVTLALFISFGLGFFMTQSNNVANNSQLGAVTKAVTEQANQGIMIYDTDAGKITERYQNNVFETYMCSSCLDEFVRYLVAKYKEEAALHQFNIYHYNRYNPTGLQQIYETYRQARLNTTNALEEYLQCKMREDIAGMCQPATKTSS